MNGDRGRIIGAGIKVAILIVGLWVLYHFWSVPQMGSKEESSAASQPIVTVHTALIRTATVRQYLTVFGSVQPAPATRDQPSAAAAVSVLAPALVATVDCQQGEHVEKGQTLFTLDGRVAEAAVGAARKRLDIANDQLNQANAPANASAFTAWQRLRAQFGRDMAQGELDQALAQQAMLRIVSPIAGTVVRMQAVAGESLQPNSSAMEIVDLDRLVIDAYVPAWQLASVHLGEEVEILLGGSAAIPPTTGPTTAPAASIAGKVTLVDGDVDPRNDMGSIDVSLPAGTVFRPGEQVKLRIIQLEHRDVLTVPAESIIYDENGSPMVNLVFRDFAYQQPVRVGLRDGDTVEIEGEQIRPDATVITTGAYGLANRTHVRPLDN